VIDLIAIVIFSVVLVPIVEFSSGALRIALGLVFILFSPGYVLIAALFPRKSAIGGIERIALSFGLSIAVVPLIGLALNYTPSGIRLYPILISVLAFIILMAIVAWYRRKKLSLQDRFQLRIIGKLPSLKKSWSNKGKLDRVISILLVVAILGALGTLGFVITNPKVGEKFTEFYILGADGKADNYPKEIKLGNSAEVTVGIINREQELITYTVEVTIDGEDAITLGPFNLLIDEEWETSVTLTPTTTGRSQKIEFKLYKAGFDEIYLSLHLWVDVVE
jgi:uncharacterized membrane protein